MGSAADRRGRRRQRCQVPPLGAAVALANIHPLAGRRLADSSGSSQPVLLPLRIHPRQAVLPEADRCLSVSANQTFLRQRLFSSRCGPSCCISAAAFTWCSDSPADKASMASMALSVLLLALLCAGSAYAQGEGPAAALVSPWKCQGGALRGWGGRQPGWCAVQGSQPHDGQQEATVCSFDALMLQRLVS